MKSIIDVEQQTLPIVDVQIPAPIVPVKATPFVKWAGGKRSIISEIEKRLPKNISTYYQPFVGGGAVYFAFQDLIEKATLADLNEELVLAYKVIATYTDSIIEALQEHERNHQKKNGYYMKVRKQKPDELIDVVARFLYLNKTCFNGLYRVNRSGKFNVPEGRYKNPKICDPSNLKSVAETLKKATIRVGQFDETTFPNAGDFVYCDPPYDGTFTGYQAEGFGEEDQIRLKEAADSWSRLGVSVMISNSDTQFIRELYKDYSVHSITAQRNISCNGNRDRASEVLIMSYE